jgi:hypothetical protein
MKQEKQTALIHHNPNDASEPPAAWALFYKIPLSNRYKKKT